MCELMQDEGETNGDGGDGEDGDQIERVPAPEYESEGEGYSEPCDHQMLQLRLARF
jgi:hypothetical protein